ncbi:MAG: putative RNA uridine N3 methyltransferase [Thermoproteus sp.]
MDIAIPHDVLAEAPDEESKVRKLGYIARGAAAFRVENIIIYTYGRVDWDEVERMRLLLEYAATPPHLRKKVFKLDRRLRLAGLLPPLKIPSHLVSREPSVGDVIEGVVERWDGYYSMVYIGGRKYAKVPKPYPIGSRLIVKIEAETDRPDIFRAVVLKNPPDYWGYKVAVRPFRQLAEGYDVVIYTGREGRSICEGLPRPMGKVLVVFGGPRAGVDEIAKAEGVELKGYFLNFAPRQGVETIRTEEAVFIVLALLNYAEVCSVGRPVRSPT